MLCSVVVWALWILLLCKKPVDLVHSEARHAILLQQGQPGQALGPAMAELTQACNMSVPALTI